MVRRTKKAFKDYNEYRDRVFGLKWGTAFALDDLMKGVRANENYALKDNKPLRPMDRKEIDIALSESFLQHKEVALQLNLHDEFGRLLDTITGYFLGEAYEDYFVIDNKQISWEDVRHISVIEPDKWFNTDIFAGNKEQPKQTKEQQPQELLLEKDEFYQEFPEEYINDDNTII